MRLLQPELSKIEEELLTKYSTSGQQKILSPRELNQR